MHRLRWLNTHTRTTTCKISSFTWSTWYGQPVVARKRTGTLLSGLADPFAPYHQRTCACVCVCKFEIKTCARVGWFMNSATHVWSAKLRADWRGARVRNDQVDKWGVIRGEFIRRMPIRFVCFFTYKIVRNFFLPATSFRTRRKTSLSSFRSEPVVSLVKNNSSSIGQIFPFQISCFNKTAKPSFSF